jgi:two-component system, LytTR family, sensor kinase
MMTTGAFRPYLNIGVHVLGWLLLGFLLLFYIPLTWNVTIPGIFWIWQAMVLLIMLGLFYINALVIVPETIIKAKAGRFIIWLLAAIFVIQLAAYIYTSSTHMHARMSALLGDKRTKSDILDNFVFTITLLVLGISTSWAMLQHWQQAALHKQQLEQDKTAAELAMLKTQINPHFFFNSLNSIYSLTYINVEDSRKALHTLSRMMRYLLYGKADEKTTLLEEADFLKDYISLMRLRSTDKVQIITNIPAQLTDYPIAPMLLLPFVENAFKHGIDATAGSQIGISLSQEGQILHLQVVNSVFEKNNESMNEGGIGLANTRRRLQLLYPQGHLLSTGINQDGKYEVNLRIDLMS